MDYSHVARELLTALRGRRSQVAWSRRLGYRSNVAYAWESGRRWPTAAETLRAASRTRIDLRAVFQAFYGQASPAFLTTDEPLHSPAIVAEFLSEMRGTTSISDLARHAGLSRYQVSRWLSGATQPKLPAFLRLIEAASLRAVDFVTCLVPAEQVPSIQHQWRRLEAHRRAAFDAPWTQAVLRVLELDDYLALPKHVPGWISARLGITLDEERLCVDNLVNSGQIVLSEGRYSLESLAVDTRQDAKASRHLKAHWSRVGTQRIEAFAPGQFSYNVFAISAGEFEQIRELHLSYYHALRAIVGEATQGDHVAVANIQLFLLDPPE